VTIATALGHSGAVNPDIVISSASFVDPRGLAFDAIGNAWVSDASNVLLQFAASDLASTGTRTPLVTLGATAVPVSGGTANSLDDPEGLAFDDDDSGNLWVANISSNNVGSLVEYTASQLSSSGSPSPNVFLNSDVFGVNFHTPGLIIFGPIP
jgi:serine/threonine protein kinase, bacterial